MNKDIERIVYDKDDIACAVNKIGALLTADYAGKRPIFVCILKGSVVFFSDLIRAVDLPLQIDFMTAKSYGMESTSSGNVKITKDLDNDIEGRDVVLVEDIVDSAITLRSVIKMLELRRPSSLKTVALLNKMVPREIDFVPEYKCFDVENEFIVGYGLDYAERYRNLPYIGVLKRSVYE